MPQRRYIPNMAQRLIARFAALLLACSFSVCRAQQPQHITISGRDVAVWKPSATAPASGYPLIVFSHGFTGCNTQTKFLMEALAEAGYLVLAASRILAEVGRPGRITKAVLALSPYQHPAHYSSLPFVMRLLCAGR